ncbi:MAG: hypothetical protein FWD03_04655 [Defluviitaleaceae bacterium]|nr:hypothetical protein [Defluviitaleaceae bacterium]
MNINILNIDDNPINTLDSFFDNPSNLAKATPEMWYKYLKRSGCDPKPLRKGSIGAVEFEKGGGYKVNWNGDKMLQYHPPGRNHHGGSAYYKLSSGASGTMRFNLKGEPLPREKVKDE